MLPDFEDFCTWVFVGVDDIWKSLAPFFQRPGPKPECPDRELIAMSLIGECRGGHQETELLSCWQASRSLFRPIPSPSRFNRRRRNLRQAGNMIRQGLVRSLDLSGDGKALDATDGKAHPQKQTILG